MWFRSNKECKEAAENLKKKKMVLSKPTAVCVDFHPTVRNLSQPNTLAKKSLVSNQSVKMSFLCVF